MVWSWMSWSQLVKGQMLSDVKESDGKMIYVSKSNGKTLDKSSGKTSNVMESGDKTDVRKSSYEMLEDMETNQSMG